MSKKISQLPSGSATTTSSVPIVEGGTTYKASAQSIGKTAVENVINSGVTDLAPSQGSVYTALNLRLLASNNLSDVANVANARANLNITPANIGAAAQTHAATHAAGGSDVLTGNLDANARVTLRKNSGANTGTRRRINLIEGAGISLTLADDSVDEEIDVTISSIAGGAPSNAQYIVVSLDGTLTDERTLSGGEHFDFADGGAGGAITISSKPCTRFYNLCTDFLDNNTSIFSQTNSGTAASAQLLVGESGHPGILELDTGTTTGGRCMKHSETFDIIRITGTKFVNRFLVRIPTLSDGTDTFVVRAGFLDLATGESVDAVAFRYTHSENAGNWTAYCRQNSIETTANTSVAVVAGTWVTLEVRISEDGLTTTFYINSVLAATITTNIPNAAGRELGYGYGIFKSAGTAVRTLHIDAWSLDLIHSSR
jgi:hypothetical protein